jgi:LmbE family N-acetylglucosaminyl deacetylase
MVIVAHPDDIEFGCAGTMARWIQEGAIVCYVLVTSGDVGIADLSLSREEAMAIREKEQDAAAAVIGVIPTAWWSTIWRCAGNWCARFVAFNRKWW